MDRPNPGLFREPDPEPLLDDQQAANYDEATAGTHRHEVAGTETDETAGGTYRTGTSGAFRHEAEQVMSTPDALRRFDPWNYRDETALGDGADVVGYAVHAIDGHIGKIDESSTLVGESYLVVDTGPWIFGKRVLLPAGTVNHVDSLEGKVYVDRTKSQIRNSPEFDPDTFGPEYRDKLGGYYDSTYQEPAGEQPVRDHSTWGDSRGVE